MGKQRQEKGDTMKKHQIKLKDLYELLTTGKLSNNQFTEWLTFYRYKHWGIGWDEGIQSERDALHKFIEEFRGQEHERNAMFGEGYDFALEQMESFIKGRERR